MRSVLVVVLLAGCTATPEPGPQPPRVVGSPAAPDTRTPLERLEASRDLDDVVVGAARTPTVVLSLASWCHRCRSEIEVFDHVRIHVPHVRWLGINYLPYEEYADRGSPAAIRALANATPWIRIIPADDSLFDAFGAPPKVPTVWVYESSGALVKKYDRRDVDAPDEPELETLLRSIR